MGLRAPPKRVQKSLHYRSLSNCACRGSIEPASRSRSETVVQISRPAVEGWREIGIREGAGGTPRAQKKEVKPAETTQPSGDATINACHVLTLIERRCANCGSPAKPVHVPTAAVGFFAICAAH